MRTLREPNWRRYLRFWRPSAERDVDDELRFHFRERVDELMAKGLSADEAHAAAEARFGHVGDVREQLIASTRRVERRRTLHERALELLADLRRVLRGLRAEPVLAAGIVLTFAAGIGANGAMFDMLDRLLFEPPPHVVDPARVRRVFIIGSSPYGGQYQAPSFSYPGYVALERTPAFARTAAYSAFQASVGAGASAWDANVVLVSSSFFPLLGAQPVLGRSFTVDEDRPGCPEPGVMLSSEAWHARFGGDSSILGKTIEIAGWRYPIVGVAPPEFTGIERTRVDLWLPLSANDHGIYLKDWANNAGSFWLSALVRLRRGTPVSVAESEATAPYRRFFQSTHPQDSVLGVRLLSVVGARLPDGPTTEARVSAWLTGVAGLVFIIACANVATLLLLRAMRRRREVAIRRALGMSTRALGVQLLLESVVLALLGGGAALLAMRWVSGPLRAVLLPDVAWSAPAWSARVVMVTVAGVLVAALVTAVVPLAGIARSDLSRELRSGGHGVVWRRGRLHSALLVAQAALSVTLLVGAGLFLRSLHNAQALDFGYDLTHVLKVKIAFPGAAERHVDPGMERFYREALVHARAVPGVTHAALGESDPGGWSYAEAISIPGRDRLPTAPGGGPYATAVTPDYFRTIGTPILRGRDFTDRDRAGAEPVVIVSKSVADLYWPGADPIGLRVHVGSDSNWSRVVGVAGDIRQYGVTDSRRLWLYTPWAQSTVDSGVTNLWHRRGYTLFVRTSGDAARWEQPVRQAIARLDPTLPYVSVRPLEAVIAPQLQPWRLGATMLTAFGLLATALAALGLYSVVAYSVAQRRRELAVRTALGAKRDDLVRLVVADAARVALVGVVLGLGLGGTFGHYVSGILFRTSGFDPLVLAVAAVALLLVSLGASAIPGWRMGRVDPATALRTD